MRAVIAQAIANDATLGTLGVVPNAVYAGDVDTPGERPFIQLRWGQTTPGLSTVDNRVLVVWVHDTPGDFTRIDSIVRRIKELFRSIEATEHDAGWILTIEWVTDSDDLSDDGHGTITRNTTHNLVSSGN